MHWYVPSLVYSLLCPLSKTPQVTFCVSSSTRVHHHLRNPSSAHPSSRAWSLAPSPQCDIYRVRDVSALSIDGARQRQSKRSRHRCCTPHLLAGCVFCTAGTSVFMWKSGHISPGATDSAQILSCLGRAHHPATAAMATLHSMCTRSSSDTYALLVRAYLPASRALATVSSRTPTRPLRLSRRTGHGRRATCRVEDLHTAWHAHQRGQRPCSQLLATNLSFLNPPKLQLLSPLHCPSLPHIAAIQART